MRPLRRDGGAAALSETLGDRARAQGMARLVQSHRLVTPHSTAILVDETASHGLGFAP